jgi:hypothetical protein
MDSPNPTPPASPYFKPMTLALAGAALALSAALPTFALPTFAALKPEYGVWNASVIGALAIFAAARLGLWQGLALTAAAIALKDVCLYFTTHWWEPYPLSWVYFAGYALLGRALLRNSASVGRAVATGLGSALLFFLVSNYVSWREQAYPYGYSLRGLWDCYVAAIPFFRGTLVGDVCFTAALFGAHAALSRAYFPAERVGVVVEEVRETEGRW